MHPPGPLIHEALPINDIRMYCLEYESDGPPLLLLHSISGNGHLFDGLVSAGLASSFRLLVPDMRGRGRTEAPLHGYSLDDGCRDIIALLDHFGIERIAVCGHSFGGLLALYFAARFPERVTRLVMLDAAPDMHPAAPMMVALADARLDGIFLSSESYLAMVRLAPFVDRWFEEMRGFFLADIKPLGLGVHTTRSRGYVAALASLHVYSLSTRQWRQEAAKVCQPVMLLQANRPFFMGIPMLTDDGARAMCAVMPQTRHLHVRGNHLTMLFGPGAEQITTALTSFLAEPAPTHDAQPVTVSE